MALTGRNGKKSRFKIGSRERGLLEDISVGDFTVAVLLGSRSTKRTLRIARERARQRFGDHRAIKRLTEKGYIIISEKDVIKLTAESDKLLRGINARRGNMKEEWNGKWHIVMYDIPIMYSSLRYSLRHLLIRAGFRKLNHSVWVLPFQSTEIEQFIKRHKEISQHVLYLTADPFPALQTMKEWLKLDTVK